MAVYLGLDHAAYLQDLLWAECETTWWVMPAHERRRGLVDLHASMSAFHYARLAALLGERLDGEVSRRLLGEVRRRVLGPFADPRRHFWWERHTNNWNAVCNGAIGMAALLVETDPKRLSRVLAAVLENLTNFLDGFAADGGCSEGPSYWRFGFGWYVQFAAALYDFTAGRVNLMAGEGIRRICRYPLAVTVAPGQDLSFADAHSGYLPLATAALVNRFQRVPELFSLCRRREDGTPVAATLTDLLAWDGSKRRGRFRRRAAHLPALGVAMLRGGRTTVGAKAGHNGEHHNHNDVGSFLVHRGGTFFLTDLGAPVYSRRTFSERRYESVFCNSLGHGVPVVNGQGQQTGEAFAGTMAVGPAGRNGKATVRIEMAGAYGLPGLERLSREIALPARGGRVELTDTFRFSRPPESLVEVFITVLPAEAAADGKSVTVRSESDGTAELRAPATAGRFRVEELTDQSAECRGGELIRRIVFAPDRLAETMTLRFAVRFR